MSAEFRFSPHPLPRTDDDMSNHFCQENSRKGDPTLIIFSSTSVDLEQPESSAASILEPKNIIIPPPELPPTPSNPPLTSSSSDTNSMASTPPSNAFPSVNHSKKGTSFSVQLIDNLPVARTEALKRFDEIIENNYQYKTLGRSREALESMTCDCVCEDVGSHNAGTSCGPNSDCINRLTQVECLPDDCRSRTHCQNQRFQKRQYANIEIVMTEKKGFGLRAESAILKDTFIYEYVGDVVSVASFRKRMRDYATEQIEHFYFMMLQKDEFIDATKSGGIGRFANHSCKPNCYVAKWTIGQFVRMGIFAKRDITKYEELTFNYNVDRYGHQAQTCYCGELNCLGYIGGKTQTDMSTVDDLYLDALGITDEADILELKGSKKRKGKRIDDPDFMPTLKPLLEKDVPKVVQAIRQTQSRKMLLKFLTRIKITEDQVALRQIMRLRGYSVMTIILEDHSTDFELINLVIECVKRWPLLNRNKVEDSRIATSIQKILGTYNVTEELRDLANSLLSHWNSLPLYSRISKRLQMDQETTSWSLYDRDDGPEKNKRMKFHEAEFYLCPIGPPAETTQLTEPIAIYKPSLRDLTQAVIANATAKKAAEEQEAKEAAKEKEAAAEARQAKLAEQKERKKLKAEKKAQSHQEKELNKEKKLQKLVGAVVVKCMSTYGRWMEHDIFKKHAKALTQKICDTEKNSSKYQESKLDGLSEEKVKKIKKYAKEYINKLHHKMQDTSYRSRPPSTATDMTSNSTTTPTTSPNGIDVPTVDINMEDILDIQRDTPNEDEEVEERMTADANTGEFEMFCRSPHPSTSGDLVGEHCFDSQISSDPRRRLPIDEWQLHPNLDALSATS